MEKNIKIISGIIVVVLVIIAIYSLYPQEKNSNDNYIGETHDARFFGTWINASTNQSPEYPLAWYTFYPNGTCLTPIGEMWWYTQTYTYKNVTDDTLHLEKYENHSLTFADVYDPYSFSDNNNTLTLNRTIFSYGSNSNWNFTSRTYYKMNKFIGTWKWSSDSHHDTLSFFSNGTFSHIYSNGTNGGTYYINYGKLVLSFSSGLKVPFSYSFSNDYTNLTITVPLEGIRVYKKQ